MTQPPVSPEQRQAAERMMKMLQGAGEHKPILKSLREIGITPRVEPVPLMDRGGEIVDCVVIPYTELMTKEYEYMSGFRMETQYGGQASSEVGGQGNVLRRPDSIGGAHRPASEL